MTPIRGKSDKLMRQSKALACFHVFPVLLWMVFSIGFSVPAAILNEWAFESDANGLQLSDTINSGLSAPPARFASGFGSTVFTTNRTLICIGTDDGTGGAWTNGAILDATPVSSASGVSYLRYDVAYNFNPSTNNNSGAVLGVYFTGASNAVADRVAGMVLGYDVNSTLASAVPSTRRMIAVTSSLKTGLSLSGTLTAIAEVDLSLKTLKVWYGVNGSIPTDYSAAAFTVTNNGMTSITNLRFHATGDFRLSADSANYAAVDNIRMADTWVDITAPIPDFSKGPKVGISRVIITTPKGTFTNANQTLATVIGETNTVEVVIQSLGSTASNITSSVAADRPEYSLITSNNPTAIRTYPEYATNTFSVVIKPNASNESAYLFNVGATAAGASGVSTGFSLTAGGLISYKTNSITVVSTSGFLPGYEPGEILDIIVTSENVGTRPVSNIVNSLTANPAYFSITNLTSTNYTVLAVDATASTTYRVTILPAATNGTYSFSVTNWSASAVWTGSFLIDVFNQGIPSVFPTNITMNMLVGKAVTNREVTVDNSGNGLLLFYITDDRSWNTFYDVTPGTRGILDFATANSTPVVLNDPVPTNRYSSATNAGVSSALSIGFNFPFYGTVYSNFYVTADGYIGLINTTNTPITASAIRTGPLTGGSPLIAPFWGTLASPAGSIKTIRSGNNLIVSYFGVSKENSTTNLQFQTALFTDGRIEFRYKNIDGVTNRYGTTNVTIGLQGSKTSYTNLAINPVNGTSVLLTPQQDQWVKYPTQTVGVDPQSAVGIVFTADASGRTVATSKTFKAWFNWSTGLSNSVTVIVNVSNSIPVYSADSSLSFTGAAGQVTSAPFIIANDGEGPLRFSISGNASTGVVFDIMSTDYNWIDISSIGTSVKLIDPDPNPYITAEDEGYSDMIPIGFVFPYCGRSYTQFVASVNGALRLDTTGRVFTLGGVITSTNAPAQMIAPYWGDLALDSNATLKYHSNSERLVVTWENVRQYGQGGGSNLTFQAILARSGDITFQYKVLEGERWPHTTYGLRDVFKGTARTTGFNLRPPGSWTVTNLPYSGMVYSQFVYAVSNLARLSQTKEIQTIRYTPASGIIPADSEFEVTITGDASNQTPDNSTGVSVVANTTLAITHNVDEISTNIFTETLAVTFSVTNSQESIFVRAAAVLADGSIDSDGDGVPDDLERIAGTDPQNADSVFTPTISRDSSGTLLSWPAPLDGVQRNYTLYFTTNLMSLWEYLYTVTNGVTYLDTVHSNVPAIYYKITIPAQ